MILWAQMMLRRLYVFCRSNLLVMQTTLLQGFLTAMMRHMKWP